MKVEHVVVCPECEGNVPKTGCGLCGCTGHIPRPPYADIAETISNEAVYLEALEQIAEVVRIVARGVNVTADDMKKLADYADGFVQIKSIVFTALDVVNTGTGEVDRTQEYEEDKLSNSWNS